MTPPDTVQRHGEQLASHGRGGVGMAAEDTMSNVMMDYYEAAAYLGLSKGTLYAMVSRRQIPHVRLGPRLVRFSRAELDAWLDARTVMPERPTAPPTGGSGAPTAPTVH